MLRRMSETPAAPGDVAADAPNAGLIPSAAATAHYGMRTGISALTCWFVLSGLLLAQATAILIVGGPLLRLVRKLAKLVVDSDFHAASHYLDAHSPDTPSTTGPSDFWSAFRWMCVNAAAGLATGGVAFVLLFGAAVSLTCPLWWWALPSGIAVNPAMYPVSSWPAALATPLVGAAYLTLFHLAALRLARWHARLAHRVLTTVGRDQLTARIAEVTASRNEALEAHGAELRRIERDLHDGTQNRLVAVRMHLGILDRLLEEDPERARGVLALAKEASDDALADLRDVVRGIYPPLLAERGLASAVTALASRSSLPCDVEVGELARAPAAVETAAYFVAAEALSNAAKHSGATHTRVGLTTEGSHLVVTVTDDGRGGMDENGRRVAAFEGTTDITSPPGGPSTIKARLPCEF